MIQLQLPEQIKGKWEHALILSYGANIPFYEHAIWSQFGPVCRNRIVLADSQQYLQASAECARDGVAHHLNQRYVFDGIFSPYSAHAKVILLANPEQGRLFVGSGNLGWQGYASGGEIFTQYDFAADSSDQLPAFLAIRSVIEIILERKYVGPVAERHIHHLFESTPWLFHSVHTEWNPVRSNLAQSFLSQLQKAIGREAIEELWIASPFLDPEASALERLLSITKPGQATLLLQPGHASASLAALKKIQRLHPQFHVRTFKLKGNETAYVHGKLYLFKLARRSICLQGSPNLSQVAMLLSDPGWEY